jgi:hypothetical protein
MNAQCDIDLPWVAVDAAGRLAVFTTADQGPVPASALQASAAVEAVVAELSVVGGSRLLVDYPRPDDFVAFAERGLYAYDWCDAHRTAAASKGCYELVAVPLRPVLIGELPEGLRLPFEATLITNACFGASQCRVAT